MRTVFVALALLLMARGAAADAVLLTYEEGGNTLSITRYGTVDAVLRRGGRARSCHFEDSAIQSSVMAALQSPDVRTALSAHAVFDGPASRIVARSDTIEWKANAPAPGYSVRLLRLELEVELLKARVRCPV